MKIYISSTYEDLFHHRAAVAQILTQMGHEVVAMEGYSAEGIRPLVRCLQDVDSCDLCIGIFAWRYGSVPKERARLKAGKAAPIPDSFTTAEIRHAIKTQKRPIVFLVDPRTYWPAHLIDAVTGENEGGAWIRKFRAEMETDCLVAYFTSPDDLARKVSPAIFRRLAADRVTSIGQKLESGLSEPMMAEDSIADLTLQMIQSSLRNASNLTTLQINLKDGRYWWSTRLFFLACVAEEITGTKLIIFTKKGNDYVGAVTPASLRDRLLRTSDLLRKFDLRCQEKSVGRYDLERALDQRAADWNIAINRNEEIRVRRYVSDLSLKRWLREDLEKRAIEQSEQLGSPGFLKDVLNWRYAFVPITSDNQLKIVVDRKALAQQLAMLFVQDIAATYR